MRASSARPKKQKKRSAQPTGAQTRKFITWTSSGLLRHEIADCETTREKPQWRSARPLYSYMGATRRLVMML